MTDPQKENTAETPVENSSKEGTSNTSPVSDAEQVESAEAAKPLLSSKTAHSSDGSAEIKPNKPPVVLAKQAEAQSKPAPIPIKVPMVPKSKVKETTSLPVPDSSISIDGNRDPHVGALIVDAIAAAIAIAFTVLLAQDIIPFL